MQDRFDRFTTLILNINRYIQKIKCHEMEELGLKGGDVQCLFHLFQQPEGLTSTQLCALCGEDKAAISRTLKELEKDWLVYVDEGAGKKYRNPIKLTEKGRKVAELVVKKIEQYFSIGSRGVANGEREKFYDQLTNICENLKKISENFGGEND